MAGTSICQRETESDYVPFILLDGVFEASLADDDLITDVWAHIFPFSHPIHHPRTSYPPRAPSQ